MTLAKTTFLEELCQFAKQFMDDSYCLELLWFFGRYPHTRFSERVVVHALNSNNGNSHTKRALRQLVNKGVVRISINHGIPFYSLTEEESSHSLVSGLARLDWHQWQLVFRPTCPTSGRRRQFSTQQGRPLKAFRKSTDALFIVDSLEFSQWRRI